jgi:hypothetical protein
LHRLNVETKEAQGDSDVISEHVPAPDFNFKFEKLNLIIDASALLHSSSCACNSICAGHRTWTHEHRKQTTIAMHCTTPVRNPCGSHARVLEPYLSRITAVLN